ncbi:MAG: SanA/YdcF family protein [Aureispira sp.]
MRFKKIVWTSLISFVLLLLGIFLIDNHVKEAYHQRLYKTTNNLPKRPVGLILGTNKRLKNGQLNRYYTYRIDAAVALWEAGKVKQLVLSGDNSRVDYNEPADMQADLVARGVPKERLILDHAGFRTLDSVVRCRAVFGFDQIIIISQRFHIERAIFIAQHKDIDALGIEAKGIEGVYGLRVQIREKLARVKLILDLLWGVEPHFL